MLETRGHILPENRPIGVRRAARFAESLEALGTAFGSRLLPQAFSALYATWGATLELTTPSGYESIEATTPNPVLAELRVPEIRM